MAISEALKKLAQKLQSEADEVLAEAEGTAYFEPIVDIVANAVKSFEDSADTLSDIGFQLTHEKLEELAAVAQSFDESGDELLQKQASVLDEILLTVAAPKNAVGQAQAKTEEEINRLRAEYREKHREEYYKDRTRDSLYSQNNKEQATKAVKEQVKRYRPLEAPLLTRYCPDHPGAGMSRIADTVYQCILDKKIYNYRQGFTTMKGNKIPGGGVDLQTPDWGHREHGQNVFDTRQSLMSRYAAGQGNLKKKAQSETLPFDLTEEEARGLAYIADRYDSGRILYDEWDSEEKTIPKEAVNRAFWATRGDGGDLGTVPLAGGSLAEKIDDLFKKANVYMSKEPHETLTLEEIEVRYPGALKKLDTDTGFDEPESLDFFIDDNDNLCFEIMRGGEYKEEYCWDGDSWSESEGIPGGKEEYKQKLTEMPEDELFQALEEQGLAPEEEMRGYIDRDKE